MRFLQISIENFKTSCLILVGFVASIIIKPFSSLLVFAFLAASLLLYRYSVKALVEIKRLESKVKSPILAHMNHTIDGLSTIRAAQKMNVRELLVKTYQKHLDRSFMANFLSEAYNRWLGIRIDLIYLVFKALVLTICVILKGTIYG